MNTENSTKVKKITIKSRMLSFKYAFRGIWYVVKNEHNAWIHSFAAISVIIAGFYFKINLIEWSGVVFAIGLVFIAEIFNTAIEKMVDLISEDIHPLAGLVKDIAAGGVLFAAITATIIGVIIFYPKLISYS